MQTNLLREYNVGGKEALVAAKLAFLKTSRPDDALDDGKGKGTELETYKCGQKRPLRDEDRLHDRKKLKEAEQSQDDHRLPGLLQAEMVKTPNCSFEYEPHFDIKVSDSFFDEKAARSTLDQESTYLPPFNTTANITTSQSRPFSMENIIETTSSKDSQGTMSSVPGHNMFNRPAQASAPLPYQSTTFDQGSYSAMLQLPGSSVALSASDFSENLNTIKMALLKDIKTSSDSGEKVQKICTLQAWAKSIAIRPMKEEKNEL